MASYRVCHQLECPLDSEDAAIIGKGSRLAKLDCHIVLDFVVNGARASSITCNLSTQCIHTEIVGCTALQVSEHCHTRCIGLNLEFARCFGECVHVSRP